MKNFIIISIIY